MKISFYTFLGLILLAFFSNINCGYSQINLQIPSADIAPIIDGTIDPVWGSSESHELNNILFGVTTLPSDFSANFKTLWDTDNLYVLAVVTDDSKINDSGSTVYLDDAVEVYLDINNDKLTSYGTTDYQYSFRWNDLSIYGGPSSDVIFKIKDTPTGYILEVKFPWTTLNLTSPSAGVLLGFDLHVHDDDDGGERDNKLAWFTTTDLSWQNPSLFATARLANVVNTDSVEVTFRVDMQNEVVSSSGVHLNGSFCGWGNAVAMQASGNIYSTTLNLKKGETIEYKFINGGITDGGIYETPTGECAFGNYGNRKLVVPQYSQTLDLVCFGTCWTCVVPVNYPADKPKISAEKGFYKNPFDVTISTAIPGMDIYYTLDGSDPATSTTSIKKSAPAIVRIDPDNTQNRGKTPGVVLRACAKKVGYDFSAPVTRTYLFIDKVKDQTSYPGHDWPAFDVNGQQIDLLMDPVVLNDIRYKNLIDDALTEIPSISVTTDNNNLFNTSTGIYVNAQNDGVDWERPASVELINPDGSDGFQIDAGLRIRGGYSRNTWFRKHAFRLFFKKEYGEGKLNFPLFDKEGVSSFDKVDLRCAQNYSWSKGGEEAPYYTFTRDVFSRDVQRAMSQPYTRSRYYHLYLNGLYWGLYQTQERSEASYAASYFGGSDSDYDVIKQAPGGIGSTNGDENMTAWRAVFALCESGFSSGNTNYNRIQGLDATGKRDPKLNVMVDIDNLIDYMNVIFYTGNYDAPFSSFSHAPNNFYIIYNRNDKNEGFKFFAHDSEHSLLIDPVNAGFGGVGLYQNRVNLGSASIMNVTTFSQFQPQWLHYRLSQNAEYRMRFADRAYNYYYNKGILTPAKTAELFRNRTLEIDTAVIAESARWGDVDGSKVRTKDDDWVPIVNKTLNEYFPFRTNIVINQLKEEGLLPSVVAPVFKKSNVTIEETEVEFSPGNSLSIINQNGSGSIKYTVDGSDPRLTGGGVSAKAVDGGNQANISILQTSIINARVFSNGNWSPLHTLKVIVDAQISGLQLTEIHYNPLGGDGLSGSEYEFIELKNSGTLPINITASTFIDGVKFSFNKETIINPGKFIVLASSAFSFNQRYGFAPFGDYDGQLDNGGERITLINASGDTLVSVKYDDQKPWPTTPDSLGFSLVPAVSGYLADWDDGTNWRASALIGGSPNADDGVVNILPVLINEILSNSEQPAVDAIELYNPNDVQVNIGGWYLSDNRDDPKSWKIPAGTTIPAKGYKVFYEGHYVNNLLNSSSNEFGSAFSLSSHGEVAYVFSANNSGELTGYENGFDFGEIETGISFGRYINSRGKEHFVAQAQVTLNQANSYPRVGPVVINQIMYNPSYGDFEYLELVNASTGVVKLFDEVNSTPWKFSGIGFDFPPNISLAAGESVYLVESAISPEDFRFMKSIDKGIKIFNYTGSLKNEGEEITLLKAAPQYADKSEVKTPFIRIDKVDYNDNSDWPDADGNGFALVRAALILYGNDPASWTSSPQQISIKTIALANGIEGVSYSCQLIASGGEIPYTWSTVSGSLPTGLSIDPLKGVVAGIPTKSGIFSVTFKVEDQSGGSDEVALSLSITDNKLPVAINDTISIKQNYNAIANVIANDTDLDGDKGSWILTIASAPSNGTATINNDKTILYTPNKGYFGTDQLTYKVADYKGFSQAKLIISVAKEILLTEIDVRINQGSDDAEQNISTLEVLTTSGDLDLTFDPDFSRDQIIGLRFQNIDIPSGTQIQSATIQFVTDKVSDSSTSLGIHGEKSMNPVTFSSVDAIIPRPMTTSMVNWQPESWNIVGENGGKQLTPNLATIVQEIINQPGWASGNAMAFIISGTGNRMAASYDRNPASAALLHIELGEAAIPVANAGTDQNVKRGTLAKLNGSSSLSSDGKALNYHWSIVSKPAGSNSVLSNLNIVNPTFIPDQFGTYEISLWVDNGVNDSPLSTVHITVNNQQPIATAGVDQSRIAGSVINLNGSESSDSDGDPITYSWILSQKPLESLAALSSSSVEKPSFTADVAGTYRVSLVVSDGLVQSTTDEVVITVIANQVPIADAGSDEEVYTGTTVTLDGGKSSDPEGSPLTYSWTFVSKPTESSATITNPNNKKPTIQTDKAGAYVIQLIVFDGTNNSTPDQVVITSVNDSEPVAEAGADQRVNSRTLVTLDGSGSYDPDGKTLTFQWSFVTTPEGSNTSLVNSGSANPSFTPDVAGLYSIRLHVSDGTLSNDDMVQIDVQLVDVDITENITKSLMVYPNPFDDRLVVEYNSLVNQNVTFSLLSLSGSLIRKFEFESVGFTTQVLNMEDVTLNNGIYLLMMKPEIGNPKIVKVTKNRK